MKLNHLPALARKSQKEILFNKSAERERRHQAEAMLLAHYAKNRVVWPEGMSVA